MRHIFAILSVVLFLQTVRAEDTIYSVDADVKALCVANTFSFGIVALTKVSSYEVYLRRILRRDHAIECLLEVYNRGTPEAKLYALAAFHVLAPKLFEQCRKDMTGKYNPVVHFWCGCIYSEGSMLEFLLRIKDCEYDETIKEYLGG